MTPQSEKTLSALYPPLADKIRAAQASCPEVTFLVYSGYRTSEQQNQDYAQGRTLPGRQITNAKAGQSMHNYGLAADIVPYLQGSEGAENWDPETTQYKTMVAALKGQGLVWGGDWVHFKDMDHFQWPGVPVSPSSLMEADLKLFKTLPPLWAKVTAGAYAQASFTQATK